MLPEYGETTDRNTFITIVSGLPRSGTSMMMKMLAKGGIAPTTDAIRTADADNPEGYYELEVVKKLPDGEFDWLEDAKGRAVKVIATLLTYLPDEYDYRVIFMLRQMEEILASQRKMLIRSGQDPNDVDDDLIGAIYEKHLRQVNQWLAEKPEIKVLNVSYNQLLVKPWPALPDIDSFLGGGLDLEAMAGVINPDLYRHKGPELG